MTDNRQIVAKVSSLFTRYGIKSITMDDVARELGISKKTLYQIVADKRELIEMIVTNDLAEFRNQIEKLRKKDCDPVYQMISINRVIGHFISNMSLAANYDLKKYHNDLYQQVRNSYFKLIQDIVVENIEQGKIEKVYREDINEHILSKFYLIQIEQVPYTEVVSMDEYTSSVFSLEIAKFSLNGIVNDNGRKLLEEHKDHLKNTKNTDAI